MRGLGHLVWVELKLLFREPAAVFFTLAFPLLLLVIFGAIFGNDPAEGFAGYGILDLSVQGYVALIIGTATLMGLPVTVGSYREHRVFKRLQATPLAAASVIVTHIVVNGILTLVGTLILVLAGKLIFDLRLPESILPLVPAWLLAYTAFATFGFVLGGIFPTARTAQAVGSVLYFPQLFLSGAAGIPRSQFSPTLRSVTEFLPMTQIVNLVGELWRGSGWSLTAVGTLALIGVVSGLLAVRLFRWE